MQQRSPKYPPAEYARLGNDVYERLVRPRLQPGDTGKIAAVDIETGSYEVRETTLEASHTLLKRLPDAQIWCVRIGQSAVHRFGPRAASRSV